jgi:putative transposase
MRRAPSHVSERIESKGRAKRSAQDSSRVLVPIRINPTRGNIGGMNRQATKKRERERTPNNRTTTGFRISEELWAVLQPLLPVHVNTHRFGGGRPRVPDRDCADAIFYVLRTGCQWQALDQTELCAHSTAHDRFQAWVQAGVFLKLWQAGIEQFEELCGIDWDWLSLDGAMTKAPLGGEKNRPQSDRPRQERGET